MDDEADNRLLLLDLLTPVGFSLQQASNGREATEIWQAWQPPSDLDGFADARDGWI